MLFNIANVAARLNKELNAYEFGSHPAELYDPVYYILSLGGKRLRPMLTVLGAAMFTDELEPVFKPALAVEVFHNFTLLHDDIMDKAALRRGQPTVHEKWNANIAILSGDVMFVKSYELLSATDSKLLPEALQKFNECAAKVCEGQQLDMNYEQAEAIDEKQYLQMIEKKTAALLGFSLELGGLLGGATGKDLEQLNQLGINLGMAFQLKDDLLDVYGDPEKFGKQVGGDITANKKTFLLVKALELAKGEDKKKLTALLADTTSKPETKVKDVCALYDKLNIQKLAEEKIESYFAKADKCLIAIRGSLYRKTYLKQFIAKLKERES